MAHKTDVTYTLELSEDEAYTLQLLLGFVAADKEVYSISSKIDALTGVYMDCEDFDRVSFSVEGSDANGIYINTPVVVDGYSGVVIRVK